MHSQYCTKSTIIPPYNSKINSSSPIKIPVPLNNTTNNNLYSHEQPDQYSLNLNNFNPSKMSPPDHWKLRLKSRINNYNLSELSLNK